MDVGVTRGSGRMHIPLRQDPGPYAWQALPGNAQEGGSRSSPRGVGRDLAVILSVAGVYFIVGELGLHLALIHPSGTTLWASYRVCPGG
jgi:hypothetical protein